jgi:hypothetical protein
MQEGMGLRNCHMVLIGCVVLFLGLIYRTDCLLRHLFSGFFDLQPSSLWGGSAQNQAKQFLWNSQRREANLPSGKREFYESYPTTIGARIVESNGKLEHCAL